MMFFTKMLQDDGVLINCQLDFLKIYFLFFEISFVSHGSALVGSDRHELAPRFEVCQMKGTHIEASELTLFKSYEIGLLRIRPLF